jgi:hypothetical protein
MMNENLIELVVRTISKNFSLHIELCHKGDESYIEDLFFSENTLYGLAENFVKMGGKLLLLDEVHKYPNWSRELKLIYDDFSDFDEFSGFDEFNDTYQSDSVVDIQTEFNYPYALLSGSLVFGAILVLNVIVKKEQ